MTGIAATSPARSRLLLVEAEEIVGARASAAFEISQIARIDADREALRLERLDRLFEVRKWRVRQAAEVDHVGTRSPHCPCAIEDRLDGAVGSVDDLREDPRIMLRKIGPSSPAPEIGRDVHDLVGAALEGHTELRREAIEVGAHPSGQDHPVGRDRSRQPAADDLLRHQRRHLDADIRDLPIKSLPTELVHHLLQPRLGEMAGQEEYALSHSKRASSACSSSGRVSTTCVSSKLLSLSTLSRSMRRG